MQYQKGFAAITLLIGVVAVLALGGAGYVAMNPTVLKQVGIELGTKGDLNADANADANLHANTNANPAISWEFESAGEVDGIPQTKVSVRVDGDMHTVGTFAGSCSEIGASGGIDGKGLLAGELSAVQCWYAGGGDEIGVFAHEDGGYEIMVGGLSEGEEGSGMFRGDFDIKASIDI